VSSSTRHSEILWPTVRAVQIAGPRSAGSFEHDDRPTATTVSPIDVTVAQSFR
jgi:hypothetical protein